MPARNELTPSPVARFNIDHRQWDSVIKNVFENLFSFFAPGIGILLNIVASHPFAVGINAATNNEDGSPIENKKMNVMRRNDDAMKINVRSKKLPIKAA